MSFSILRKITRGLTCGLLIGTTRENQPPSYPRSFICFSPSAKVVLMLASKSGMSCNNKLRPSQHRLHNRYQRLAHDYTDTRISGSSRRYFHEKYTALSFSIWYKCVCCFRLLKRLGELMAPQRFERFNALQNY